MGAIFILNPAVGFVPMLKAFIIIILGGLGSIGGCIVAGLLLGSNRLSDHHPPWC